MSRLIFAESMLPFTSSRVMISAAGLLIDPVDFDGGPVVGDHHLQANRCQDAGLLDRPRDSKRGSGRRGGGDEDMWRQLGSRHHDRLRTRDGGGGAERAITSGLTAPHPS